MPRPGGERQSRHDGFLRIEAGPRQGLYPLDEEHCKSDHQEAGHDRAGNDEQKARDFGKERQNHQEAAHGIANAPGGDTGEIDE